MRNAGAAFSFGQGGGIVFIIVALVFLGGAMYLVWSNEDMPLWLVIPIGLVAGGGMGNMVDRLIEGKVIDFLATTCIDFPVFNVADICVTVGIVVSIIAWWTWDTRREREAEGRTNTVRPNGQGNV